MASIIKGQCPANAGGDDFICFPDGVTIGPGCSIAGYTYSWSPTTGLSNINIYNPTANPQNTTIYTLTVSPANSALAGVQQMKRASRRRCLVLSPTT